MSVNINNALLSLIPAIINAGIILYIFFYLPKNRITDIFTGVVFALILWQAEDTIIRLSVSADSVKFWDKILCIGWFAMAPLAFHFSCKLAGIKELTNSFALFMIYGPFLVLYALYLGDNNMNFLRDETWGWINMPRVGTFDSFHRYWITLMVIATVFILLRYAYQSRKNKEKKYQAWIIALAILLPSLQVILTQADYPLTFDLKEIPLASTFMSLFSFGTFVAISRYKVFQVSESIQSDTLLENLKKPVLIVSPEKKLIYINKYASSVLGIKEDQIENVSFQDIFFPAENRFEKYTGEVFGKVINKEIINNYPTTLIDRENKKMHVLLNSSPVINNNIVQGIMLVANDVTEMVTVLKDLEQERKLRENAITNAVIAAQEKDRKMLGSELHDNINQILASSLLYLNLTKGKYVRDNRYLAEMGNLIHHAISEIRKLSHSLIPPSLNEIELTEALDKIFLTAEQTGAVTVEKEIQSFDEKKVPENLKLNIYRIVQEQFNNTLKYARAKNIRIRLKQEQKKILLSIKDDGVGFDPSVKSPGVGLTNMKTRASLFNGDMQIISSPGKGCELKVSFENL